MNTIIIGGIVIFFCGLFLFFVWDTVTEWRESRTPLVRKEPPLIKENYGIGTSSHTNVAGRLAERFNNEAQAGAAPGTSRW